MRRPGHQRGDAVGAGGRHGDLVRPQPGGVDLDLHVHGGHRAQLFQKALDGRRLAAGDVDDGARRKLIAALQKLHVGRRDVAHVHDVAGGAEIADLQHRRHEAGLHARQLRREGGDGEGFGLPGADVVEGAGDDELGRVRQHHLEGMFRGDLGAGIGAGRTRARRLGHETVVEGAAVDLGRARRQHEGVGRERVDRLGQPDGCGDIVPPHRFGILPRQADGGIGGKMNDDGGACLLDQAENLVFDAEVARDLPVRHLRAAHHLHQRHVGKCL